LILLDSGFRRNDKKTRKATFYETIKTDMQKLGNHGFAAFTAISLAKDEVLYYAESW
jgi:hypothetical protein